MITIKLRIQTLYTLHRADHILTHIHLGHQNNVANVSEVTDGYKYVDKRRQMGTTLTDQCRNYISMTNDQNLRRTWRTQSIGYRREGKYCRCNTERFGKATWTIACVLFKQEYKLMRNITRQYCSLSDACWRQAWTAGKVGLALAVLQSTELLDCKTAKRRHDVTMIMMMMMMMMIEVFVTMYSRSVVRQKLAGFYGPQTATQNVPRTGRKDGKTV